MLMSIEGTPPPLDRIPPGCAFNPRCEFATDPCRARVPPLEEIGPGRRVACFNSAAVAAAGTPI